LFFLPVPWRRRADDWASGGAIGHVFAQPFAGDKRILQVWNVAGVDPFS